ncbi:MAG TPA: SsrA-binding protein SmpB [Candidatus Limnocylindrales bacterium]|nr:SsrA-binding protein SmpB [Candidatus Limnocylindrales bacterium]
MAKPAKGSKAATGRIAENRKARFNYAIEETLEAGIVLTGTEVRSARAGGVNLSDSYVRIQGGEAWLLNCRISPYPPAGRFNHDPLRERKLLLHRRQIDRLDGRSRTEGYTLVVTRMYFDEKGRLKAEVGLGRGKKLYDKRASAREKDAKREIERAMRHRG